MTKVPWKFWHMPAEFIRIKLPEVILINSIMCYFSTSRPCDIKIKQGPCCLGMEKCGEKCPNRIEKMKI